MHSILAWIIIVIGVSGSRAADTLYIPDTTIRPMITAYISKFYTYHAPTGYFEARKPHPNIHAAIRKWMSTDEGNQHALHDGNWDSKLASFYAMFPTLRSSHEVVELLLRRAVQLNFKLYYYAHTASIVTINGAFHGIIFDADKPYAWYRTVEDPVFKHIYEYGTDDEGRPWFALINNRIRASR